MEQRIPKLSKNLFVSMCLATVLLVTGFVAWQGRTQNKQPVANGPSVVVVPPKDPSRTIKEPLPQLVNGLVGQYIDQTTGSECERIHGGSDDLKQRCYQLNTILYLVDGNVTGNFQQFVDNCNKNGWTMDGEPLDVAKLVGAAGASADTTTNKLSVAAKSQMPFGLLTPDIFGEQNFLKKDNMGAIVQIYSLDPTYEPISDSDFLYVLESEVPTLENYDFQGKVVDKLKTNPNFAVLVISAGPAMQ